MISMTRAPGTRAPSVHAIGAAQLVAWGATFYALPPLLPRIASDLDVSMSVLTSAMTVGLVLSALASLAVASWIQRLGARAPMTLGSIVAAGSLAILAASTTHAVAAIAIAVLGAAQAALLYEPAFAAVSTQTRDPVARTRAIQVITFWGGWAAMWAIPSSTFLGGVIGWRATLFVLCVLLAAHTIRIHVRLPPPRFTRAESVRGATSSLSVGLATAFALGSFATTAIVVNGLLILRDRNVSITAATIAFALLAPLQVVARLWFLRRHGALGRHDSALPFVLLGAGVIALLAAPRVASLAAFVLLFGSGVGLLTMIRAAVIVSHVPAEDVARHLGAYSFVTAVARAFAPVVSSWMHGAIGFELTLLVLGAMAFVAALLVWQATCCIFDGPRRATCGSWIARCVPRNAS
jgi:hypothetical protein